MEDKVRCCIAQAVAYFFSSRKRSAIFLCLHDWIWGLLFLTDWEGVSLVKAA
jgi:hypothetical protein